MSSTTSPDILEAIRNANTQSGQFGVTAIVAGLVTSAVISFVVFIAFSVLRPRHKIVYAPKLKYADEKRAPPPIDDGLLSWLKPVWSCTDEYLLEKIGLDAVLFLRFWRMCRNIFICVGLLGVAVIIPFNVVVGLKTVSGQANVAKNNPLGLLSIEGIVQQYLWMQITFCWVYSAIVMFWLYRGYVGMIALRRKYFHSVEYQGSMHARTLLIADVPKPSRSDEGLAQLATRFKPQDVPYAQAHIGRDMGELPELLEQHEKAVKRLEKYLAVYLKNPDKLPDKRPTCKPKGQGRVDAIDYYTERVQALEYQIEGARQAISSRKTTQYGFVSYSTIPQAHTVAQANKTRHIQGTSVFLAPRPSDILWKNLAIPKSRRRTNRVIGNLLFFALTIAWTVPNALIATFVTNLWNLGAFWPAFGAELNRHTKFWALLQALLGPIILALFFLLLPTVMRRLTAWSGALTKSEREKSVTHKLYFFFVLNNIVIFTLFGIVWGLIAQVLHVQSQTGNKESVWDSIKNYQILDNISHAIIQTSSFWIMYLIARLYVSMLDLAQVFSLVYKTIRRKFSPTPRELIEWTAPLTFDFASYYNYALFYVTIALSYATIAPLVSPFALLYFTISYGVHKYDMMYVYFTRNETGGSMWRVLFNRILFAMGFANVIVFAVVYVNYDWQHAIVIVPLLPILLGFKLYCWKFLDPTFDYYIPTKQDDPESPPVAVHRDTNRDKLRTRFGHPAWTQQLITPMVHAKANHLLPTVYHGRMHNDNPAYSNEYGQSAGGIGKVELVAEQDLDYENFRNRPEFDTASLMDSATVVTGDDVSMFSVPYKESRPSTPSQVPLNPRLPAYTARGQSPLRSASPLIHQDDYFTRPPSRGAYRNDMTPGYTPAGYTADEFEMASISQRSYDPRDLSDQTYLLSRQESGRGRDPYAYGREYPDQGRGRDYYYQPGSGRERTPSRDRGYQ